MDISYHDNEITEARDRLNRVTKGNTTQADKSAMSKVPQHIRTEAQGAKYLLDKALQAQEQAYKESRARQLDLFSAGLIPPTGQDTVMAANDILRGALFGAVVKGKRKTLQGMEVLNWGDVRMLYTGIQLDQGDADILLAVIRLIQRGENVRSFTFEGVTTTRIRTSKRQLLKDLNRNTGGSDGIWLQRGLNRLMGVITVERRKLSGHWTSVSTTIVERWGHDKETKELVIDVNTEFIKLMEAGVTIFNWQEYLPLPAFTRWLYKYIHTHAPGETQHRTTEQIMTAYGSQRGRQDEFLRMEIEPALATLAEMGIITSYEIKRHYITWTRKKAPKEGGA